MSADVLGQAVDHHVHAQIKGIGVVGGGEGVVHEHLHAVTVGDLRHLGQIHQHHGGVGGGLHIDDLGVGLDEGLQLLQMVGPEGVMLDAEPGQPVAGDVLGAGVLGLGENDVVAALQRREQRTGHRTHAGGVGHRALAVLQRRQLLLHIVKGRVGDAAVREALGVVAACLHGVVGGIEIEGRGLIDGRDQGTVGVPGLTGVDLHGVEFYVLRLEFRMLHNQLAHSAPP